jgi:hypothetical protein
MRSRNAWSGAAFIFAAALVGGCESSPRRTPYADNPLLQSRQPLVQSPSGANADPAQVAQGNGRMVVIPPPGVYQQPTTTAVASGRPASEQPKYYPAVPTYSPPAGAEGPALPPATTVATAQPLSFPIPEPTIVPNPPPAALPLATGTPMPVSPLVPTEATAAAPTAPVEQAVVRQIEGKYGHAPDYTWLQGELDRHYRGHLELRYRSVSEDDPYGGKVRLEDDPRLAEFRPGDVIAVEGELLTDPDGPAAAPWAQYRRYHIRSVHIVERK